MSHVEDVKHQALFGRIKQVALRPSSECNPHPSFDVQSPICHKGAAQYAQCLAPPVEKGSADIGRRPLAAPMSRTALFGAAFLWPGSAWQAAKTAMVREALSTSRLRRDAERGGRERGRQTDGEREREKKKKRKKKKHKMEDSRKAGGPRVSGLLLLSNSKITGKGGHSQQPSPTDNN